jgi:hypothetical protein
MWSEIRDHVENIRQQARYKSDARKKKRREKGGKLGYYNTSFKCSHTKHLQHSHSRQYMQFNVVHVLRQIYQVVVSS